MAETHAQRYYRENNAAMAPVRHAMPDLLKAFGGLHRAAMSDGVLSTREKELMALAIGVAIQCENCIYAHVRAAAKAGASRDQVLEAAGVAVMMAGGPSYTYLPRVHEALEALSERGELT